MQHRNALFLLPDGFFAAFARRIPAADLRVVLVVLERMEDLDSYAVLRSSEIAAAIGEDRNTTKNVLARLLALRLIERNAKRRREYRIKVDSFHLLGDRPVSRRSSLGTALNLPLFDGIRNTIRISAKMRDALGLERAEISLDRSSVRILRAFDELLAEKERRASSRSQNRYKAQRRALQAAIEVMLPYDAKSPDIELRSVAKSERKKLVELSDEAQAVASKANPGKPKKTA